MSFNEIFPFLFLIIAGLVWAFGFPIFLIVLDILKRRKRNHNG